MNICVIGGAGYVGLITGLGLGELGHNVINVDVDEDRVRQLQCGECHYYEKGLRCLLQRNLETGRVRFSTDLEEGAPASDIVFVAVGTPSLEDGHADLSQVLRVFEGLEHCIDRYKLIAIKSTVPVGTVELGLEILSRSGKEGEDFDLVVNPEFLREGSGIRDFFYPDRIVVGACSDRARQLMRDLYNPLILDQVSCPEAGPRPKLSGPIPLVETDPASAQLIKYASNAFLAARISFINEIAGLCEEVSADIKEVSRGMGFDPRIGPAYLEAGLGFGGPCLEKDLRALMTIAQGTAYDTPLLQGVLERNQRQVEQVVIKLKGLTGGSLDGKNVGVFGAAFKAGTNDVRNSLALRVIDSLVAQGASVRVHDPKASVDGPGILFFEDPYEAVSGVDALLVLTEWPSFKDLDYRQVKELMAAHCIVDARNLLDAQDLRSIGFTYVGVGGV